MNKIYDKRYPVTSLLLLITTGVFLTMFLLRGFNYASTQTIYEFGAMNDSIFSKSDLALGIGDFCSYRLGAFCDEYDYAVFYRTTI